MNIPEIVKQHVLKNFGRMPETQQEVDQYLDLINHAKEYQTSFVIQSNISKGMMKRLGIRTTEQVKENGQKKFNPK